MNYYKKYLKYKNKYLNLKKIQIGGNPGHDEYFLGLKFYTGMTVPKIMLKP